MRQDAGFALQNDTCYQPTRHTPILRTHRIAMYMITGDFSLSHQAFCGYELSGSLLSHLAPFCARLSACSMSFPGPYTFILESDEYVLQHDVVAL